MFGWFARARITIRTRRDGTRVVRVTGLLARFASRVSAFVQAEAIPDGRVTLTRDWRYTLRGPVRQVAQRVRNWLGAECNVLPPGVVPGRRA